MAVQPVVAGFTVACAARLSPLSLADSGKGKGAVDLLIVEESIVAEGASYRSHRRNGAGLRYRMSWIPFLQMCTISRMRE